MLKTIIYETLIPSKSAIVVIDPKGDLARETARFIEHSLPDRKDNLVYVSPFDFPGFTAVLNPLRLPPVPPSQYEMMVDITTRELTNTLQNIFMEMDNSGFTGLMLSVLAPCIETLLRKGDSDFWDLMRFMDDKLNADLVALGKQSANESVRRFFEHDFAAVPVTTRDGIKWRTRNLLNSQIFARFTTGTSTIDLKSMVDQKKCIIFNLDKGSMSSTVSSQIGKLIVSLIQIIAMQRGGLPDKLKVPLHLFIDEFHNYITMSIKHVLAESRSNKLFLTVAQQLVGQDMPDRNFKKILMGNTNIKILGKSTNENYKELHEEFGLPVEQLQLLPDFYFYVKVGNGLAFRIKGRGGLVGNKNAMTLDAWERISKEQIRNYYVPAEKFIQEQKRMEDERLNNFRIGRAEENSTKQREMKPQSGNQTSVQTNENKPFQKQKRQKEEPPNDPPPFEF